MTALSVLDLMMMGEGKTFAHTLDDAVSLARHVEAHGYKRYWIAEHHDLPGIASSATTLLIQHLAAATRTLRSQFWRNHATQPLPSDSGGAVRDIGHLVSRPHRFRHWQGTWISRPGYSRHAR